MRILYIIYNKVDSHIRFHITIVYVTCSSKCTTHYKYEHFKFYLWSGKKITLILYVGLTDFRANY